MPAASTSPVISSANSRTPWCSSPRPTTATTTSSWPSPAGRVGLCPRTTCPERSSTGCSASPIVSPGRVSYVCGTDSEDGMTARATDRSAARADLAVARILAASGAEESVYPRLLAAIGESLEWDFGAWWELAADDQTLRCIETWRSASLHEGDFDSLSRRTGLAFGVGLPGRVV